MTSLIRVAVTLILAPGAVGLQFGLSRMGLRVTTGVGLDTGAHLQSAQNQSQHAVKQLEMIHHKLRICNAFAHSKPLDVYLVHMHDEQSHATSVTKDAPVAYKDCRDLVLQTGKGDKLNFKAGNVDVGTFSALPTKRDDATLLLIPHQKESNSMTLAFKSHSFANFKVPQLAVIDAYHGKQPDDQVMIMDVPAKPDDKQASLLESKKLAPRAESLRYNSIGALQLGNYQLDLRTPSGSRITQPVPLRVQRGGTYVVMRVGNDGNAKDNYPKELLVFPQGSYSS